MKRHPPHPNRTPAAPRHELLLASAGTGKTHALTTRLIALLHRGEPAETILAATFTRKAAGEILDRVLSRLAEAALDADLRPDGPLNRLRADIDPALDHAHCAHLLGGLVTGADRLSVQTLDALVSRMAGAYAFEIGLPPGWRIIEDQDARRLAEQALSEAIAQGQREALRVLMAHLHRAPAARGVHDRAQDAITQSRSAYLASRDTPAAWEAVGPADIPRFAPNEIAPAIRRLDAAKDLLPLTKDGKPHKTWANALEKLIDRIKGSRWDETLGSGLLKALIDDGSFGGKPIEPALADLLRPFADEARARALTAFADRNAATRDLARRFDAASARLKHARGTFDFDDIPRALLDHAKAHGLEHLYYRLDAAIRHVLLDEFQDTSLDQFNLLRPILDELLSSDDGRSVFVVGDAKQSLYRWRDAEPALLTGLATQWPAFHPRSLSLNFRSSPVVLDLVNRVFSALVTALDQHWDAPHLSATARQWHGLFNEHTAQHQHLPGFVRLQAFPAEPAQAEAPGNDTPGDDADADEPAPLAPALLEAMCDRIAQLHRQRPDATIAVLLRKNRSMAQIIHALRARGVEASKEGGNPLTDSPAVAATLSLLHLAQHPADAAARFHVACGPLGPLVGLNEHPEPALDSQALAKLRDRLDREGLANVLASFQHALAPSLSAHALDRYQQLIELAVDLTEQGPLPVEEFIAAVESRGVEDPRAQRVRVMTIHKAKGLEFDIVLLPELDHRWQLRSDQVLLRRDTPLSPPAVATVYPSALIQALSPEAKRTFEHAHAGLVYEELCSLYVALTRAVHHLEIFVNPATALNPAEPSGPNTITAAKLLRAALNPRQADPGACLWQSGDEHWTKPARAHTPAPTAPPASTPPADAGETQPVGPRTASSSRPSARTTPANTPAWRWSRASPSGLEGSGRALPLDELLRPAQAPSVGRHRGSLLHAWFELLEWADRPLPAEPALLAAAAALGVREDEARAAIPAFQDALARSAVRARLSSGHYAQRWGDGLTLDVRREWPFAQRTTPEGPATAAPRLLVGSMDRVVIARERTPTAPGPARHAEVLDFKTDNVDPRNDADAFARRVEHYRPQILAYRAALARRLALPPERVNAALLFTQAGVVVDITQP
jgi:ATP-dependent exoDNAse (exonuclease V) beta subunit